jgi:chorismate dehydratase
MKIGSVPYLNAKPLIEGISDVALDVPSRLTERFRRGEVDVALLPVFEAVRCPDLAIVPGICVASPGPVDSVLIFSKRPLAECREVALDESSLTSAALARVLLVAEMGLDLAFRSCGPETDPREREAILLIGDPALTAKREGLIVTDLASMWRERTGLPFCFAAWLAATPEVAAEASPMLEEAKRRGLAARDRLAAEASRGLGLRADYLVTYLTDRITYDLGEEEREALRRYGDACRRLGLV